MTEIKRFSCSICKFSASSNYCLERHFGTKKHVQNFHNQDEPVIKRFQCQKCNKSYMGASGLWTHNKKCTISVPISQILEHKEEEKAVINNSINIQGSTMNEEILEELKKINVNHEIHLKELKEQKEVNHELKKKIAELEQNQQAIQTVGNTINNTINNNTINNTINNTFNMTIFLNETCKDAVCLEDFIKNLKYELSDTKLLIVSYVDGTYDIIKKNLERLPINKRPLHHLEGEDPRQRLMHIRNDNKWDESTELNWMLNIHSDDDSYVKEKDRNQIYYALKDIDNEKLKYLAYNFSHEEFYIQNAKKINYDTCRSDLKDKIYQKIIETVKLDTTKLDDVNNIVVYNI